MVKRVYVLSRQCMFGKGLEALLSQEAEIEIVGQGADLSTAVECIHEHKPDVVIVNLDDPELDLSPAVRCILRERLGISIIGLSLLDNKISIYRGQEQQIQELEDLFRAIED